MINQVKTNLQAALSASNTTARNWSGGGQLIFAIYDEGDSFLGTVKITSGRMVPYQKWTKADGPILRRLQTAFYQA